MARVKKSDPSADESMPFEAAMEELEKIVVSLESESLPLEEMIRVYEKGMNLNRICQNRLKSAELTIKKLEKQRLESLELDNTDAESDAG